MNYHFEIRACLQPPPPQRRNRRRGVCGGGGDCTQHSALLMRLGSRGPSESFSQIRHSNAVTEIASGDAVHGLGMTMSTVASEKDRKLSFISNVFYKQLHICVLFH